MKSKNVTRSMVATVTKDKTNEDCQTVPVKVKSGIAKQSLVVPTKVLDKLVKNVNLKVKKPPPKKETKTVNTSSSTSSKVPSTVVKTKVNKKNVIIKPKVQKTKKVDEVDKCTKSASVAKEKKNVAEKKSVKQNVVVKSSEQQKIKVEPPSKIVEEQKPETVVKEDTAASKEPTKKSCTASEKNDNKKKDKSTNKSAPPATGKKKSISNINETNTETTPTIKPGENDKDKNVKNGKIPSKKQKKATIVTENKEKPKVEENAPILPVVQEIKQEPKSVKPPVQKPIPVKIEKKEVPCKKEIKDEKEETISKLIKEASRNISGKGFKKTLVMSWEIQNKSSLAVNKPKTNTKENATKETADAVDCVEKKEIKVEPIETKDIKPVIKSVKQPSGDVAGKIGAPSKKVYSKNIPSKITKANKCNAAVKATAVAAVKVKSELNSAPDEEDSHVSDEITLDVLRQHQLKEVKQETLNCVDREEDTATLDDKVNTASTMPAKQKIKVKVESSGDECVTKECQKSVPQAQSRTAVKQSKVRTPLNISPKQKHKKVKAALTKKAAFKRNVKSKLNPKMVVVKKCIVKPKQGKGSPVGSGNETDHDKKARRKLYSFWNGPKRHRVASLNAIAKVHCLYENESRGALMEMLKQPKVVKPKVVAPPPEPKVPPATRTLRSGPGMRGVGKHWDMHNASFSSSEESSSGQDSSVEYTDKLLVPPPSYKQKQKDAKAKKIEAKNATAKATPAPEVKKRRNRTEIVMDLKDMVVRKRMASLNATAILAASYSPEKRSGKTDSESDDDDDDDDDDDSTEEYDITDKESNSGKKRCYESDSKGDDSGERKVIEVHTNPNNKKVAVIVNQDTDVTITGVYVNSTTRSTHHEGYCSIAGMQYRISATSHTQTNATAVATETLLHQPPPGPDHSVDQPPTPCKSYTPLGALSSMQPPGAPPPAGPPGTSPPIGRRHHGSGSSAFSAPPAPQAPGTYGPPPPTVHGHHPHSHHHHHHHHLPPQGAKVEHPPPPGYIHGYYQPAGPLISAHHSHPHVVAQPSLVSNKTTSAPLSSLEASATPTPPPPVQPPAPSSAGESSDNDVIITATSSGSGEASVAGQPQAPQPPPAPPTLHTYRYSQSYPPPPGSHAAPPGYPYGYAAQYYTTAPGSGSLQYSPQQQQHYHHQDLCYSASSYPPPPTTYFHHKAYGTPPPPGSYHRRYIGPPPAQYYHNNPELYGTTQNAVQQSSQVVTAAAAGTPGSGSTYPPPPGGPPPTIVETYPPPTPTGPVSIVEPYPPPPYYTGYGPGPAGPACYTHSPTRSLAFIDAAYQSCPCPMQSCPKNVHTGPLTGDGKRSNMTSIAKESGLPLPPVALALPLEPASVAGPPSPARGSAGMPPPPSPAGATYQSTSTLKWDTKQESTNEISVSETKQTTEKVRRKARVGKNMVRNTIGFPNGLRQPENTMLLMCHNPNSNRTNEVKREAVTPDSDVIILDDTKDDRVEESTENVIKPVIEDSEAEECCRQGGDVKDYKRRASCSEDAAPKESEETSPPVAKSDCVELKLAVCKEEVKSEPEEESKMTCIQKLVKAKIEEIKEEKHTSTKRKLTIESIVDGKDDNAKKQKLTKNLSNYKDLIKKTNKSCVKIVNGKRKLTTGQESPKQYLLYKSPKISFAQKSNKKSVLKRKSLGAKEEIPSKKMKSSKPLAASNLHNSKQNVKKTKTHVKEIILSENKEPLVKVTVKKPEQNHKIVKKTAPALLDSLFNKNNVDRTIESVVNSVLFDEPTRKSISELYKDETRPLLTSKTTEAEASNVNKKIVKKVEPPVKIVAKTVATPKCTKTVPKGSGKRKNKVQPQIEVPAPIPKVPRKSFQSPKWSNGWSWEGDPFQGKVFLNSDEPLIVRTCYPAMRHIEGDIISPRDCVLLKAGPRKIDLPFVAKVAALWENPEDGEMMMSLLWYYRPEHTEQGRLPTDQPDEVFASRHKDTNSVACIEDKCYVLTFNEYCRYRKNARRLEEGLEASGPVVPQADGDVYPRAHRQPPATQATAPDLVFFCRRVYDFRQKRIVKNPS